MRHSLFRAPWLSVARRRFFLWPTLVSFSRALLFLSRVMNGYLQAPPECFSVVVCRSRRRQTRVSLLPALCFYLFRKKVDHVIMNFPQ